MRNALTFRRSAFIFNTYQTREPKMSNYKPFTSTRKDGSTFALVVRVDRDGETNAVHGYAGRYFKTEKAAIRSCERWIAKNA